jgi:hypothetical protein
LPIIEMELGVDGLHKSPREAIGRGYPACVHEEKKSGFLGLAHVFEP